MSWKTTIGITLLLFLFPAFGLSQPQAAQTDGDYRTRWGYGFMSPGLTNDPKTAAAWHIGGGYEWLVAKGLGFNAGAGAVIAGVEGGDWTFPVSLNAAYYLRQAPVAQRSVAPFITAGYTRAGFSKSSNMFNVGFGFNQWTQRRSGFRFEVRHNMDVERSIDGRNWFLDFRLGFAY